MCDYSLEVYRSRPAREGDEYVTHRFGSNSIGLISPGDPVTAICLAYDMRVRFEGIPETIQTSLGVTASESAIFARLEEGWFHDGIRFANGSHATLQRLGPGVRAYVEDALVAPRLERELATLKAAE